MKSLLLGLLAGIVAVPVIGFLLALFGALPVATSASPLPFERILAETALHAKISSQAPKAIGIPVNDANLLAGAQVYRDHCSECHGLPAQPKPADIAGMFPPVPLFFAHRHRQQSLPTPDQVAHSAEVTYWKARNGIRLTGMPSFSQSLTDQQLWQVSLFLASRRSLPQSAQEVLNKVQTVPGS